MSEMVEKTTFTNPTSLLSVNLPLPELSFVIQYCALPTCSFPHRILRVGATAMLMPSSARNANCVPPKSPSNRSYFYVGGRYVDDEKGESQHVLTHQMYVEPSLPVGGVKHLWLLIFIHGAGQTGTVSLNSTLCLCHLMYNHSSFSTESSEEDEHAKRDSLDRSYTAAAETVQLLFEESS